VLYAHVKADSFPGLLLAALDQARRLYGPRESAELAVEGMSQITSCLDPQGGEFRASVVVRCLNFADICPPGGTLIPVGLPEDPADIDWAESPADIGLPGISGEDV
jgi:hypothetical protein